jgi:hypothetical protein
MVEVKLTVPMAGPAGSWGKGARYECANADEAKRLIEAGYAVPVVEAKVERAIKQSAKKEKRG